MAVYNGRQHTTFGAVSLDGEGVLRFGAQRTTDLSSDDRGLYVKSDALYYWNGSAATEVGAGGGGGVSSWDALYDLDKILTIDAETLTFALTHATNDGLTLTGSAGSAGDVIQITNAGSGKDINGTSDTWSFTKAGVLDCTGITLGDDETIIFGDDSDATIQYDEDGNDILQFTCAGGFDFDNAVSMDSSLTVAGSAGSNSLTLTAGDVVFSDGSLSLTDADNAESVTIINNTATTIGAAASAGIVQLESTSLTTGALLNLQLTEGTLSGGSYLRMWDATGGSAVWTCGENGATTIAGSAAGTDALTITAGDITCSSGYIESVSSADGPVQLQLTNTNAGANGMVFEAHANSASPADNDVVFTIRANAEDDGSNETTYGDIRFIATDVTDTTEDGKISFRTIAAGVLTEVLALDASGLTLTQGLVSTAADNSSVVPLILNQNDVTNNPAACTINNAGTGNDLELVNTGAGALGAILKFNHDSASPADNDVIGKIHFYGDDDGAASTEFVKIEAIATDVTNATEDGDLKFSVNTAGTVTQKLLLDSDVAGIVVGTGAAAGVIQSDGNYDLILQTGNATTSNITITDGANGNVAANLNGTGVFEMKNTDAGALGSVLKMFHESASPADNDVIARLDFYGDDDGANDTEYAKIDVVATDVTDTTEDADILFYVQRAGSLTQQLALDSDYNGILVGDGAASAYVTSNGAYDLVLDTNSGTSSGAITITDGANGDITVQPNGTGQTQLYAPTWGQVTTKSGADTLTVAECGLIVASSAGGAFSLTLPAVSGNAGLWYTIVKDDAAANAVTLDGNGTEKINGSETYASIDAQYDTATIVCDGTEWFIQSEKLA